MTENPNPSDAPDEDELCGYGGCGLPEGQCPACLGII